MKCLILTVKSKGKYREAVLSHNAEVFMIVFALYFAYSNLLVINLLIFLWVMGKIIMIIKILNTRILALRLK